MLAVPVRLGLRRRVRQWPGPERAPQRLQVGDLFGRRVAAEPLGRRLAVPTTAELQLAEAREVVAEAEAAAERRVLDAPG